MNESCRFRAGFCRPAEASAPDSCTVVLSFSQRWLLFILTRNTNKACVKVKLHYAYRVRNLLLCIRDCAVTESKKCSADREYMP